MLKTLLSSFHKLLLKTQTEIGYNNKSLKFETAFISYTQNIQVFIS